MMACSGIGVLSSLNSIREEEDEEEVVDLASELEPWAVFCGGVAYRAQAMVSAVWDWSLVSVLSRP
jgi:hypothetical protein